MCRATTRSSLTMKERPSTLLMFQTVPTGPLRTSFINTPLSITTFTVTFLWSVSKVWVWEICTNKCTLNGCCDEILRLVTWRRCDPGCWWCEARPQNPASKTEPLLLRFVHPASAGRRMTPESLWLKEGDFSSRFNRNITNKGCFYFFE